MRRLIVCCDGTWKTADDGVITNVVKMMDAIVPVARRADESGAMTEVSQVTYYTKGVGSGGNILDRVFGGAFGQGLATNIRDCYRFLVQNYEPGDEIYLFGFSRGAYTARSLAGMIRCCGLVDKKYANHITEAYNIYRQQHPEGADKPDAVAFRDQYANRDLRIKFIGLWDTVGALGVPVTSMLRGLSQSRHGFHDTRLSGMIDHAYHAMALDEGRYTFEQSPWKGMPKDKQRVEQVWFAGAHSDVGGGYKESGLSDIAFQWMAEKAAGCGLMLSTEYLSDRTKVNPDPSMMPHDARYLKFLPGNIRDVARYPGWSTESVHPSAMEKMKDPAYQPENLREFVQRRGSQPDLGSPVTWINPNGEFIPETPLLKRPPLVKALRRVFGATAAERQP